MAEAKIDVMKSLASYVVGKEKVVGVIGIETGVTASAENMALKVGKLVGEGIPKTERSAACQELSEEIDNRLDEVHAKGVINSVDQLNMWLIANEGRMDTMNPDELKLVQLAYDIKDGVALAMVANAGSRNLDANLQANARKSDSAHQIDVGLGLNSGSVKVLEGMGQEIKKTLITDKDVLTQLKKLQVAMNTANYVGGLRSAVTSIGRLYDDNSDSDEILLAYEYVNAMQASIEAGQRRGGGGIRPNIAPVGGEAADGVPGSEYDSAFKVTLSNFIDALKGGGQIRFDDHDLPGWAEHPEISDPGKRAEASFRDCERAKIHSMAEVKSVYGEGDFQKMRLNTGYEMTEKELAVYWGRDTQLAGQIIVQDLMEFYIKDNGIKMLVFKTKSDGLNPTDFVSERMANLSTYVDEVALRLKLYKSTQRLAGENEEGFKNRIKDISGKWFDDAIKDKVLHPAGTLAFPVEVGNEEKLCAYSVREFMFIALAFSQADRHRMFAPIPRAIQDPERYILWMDQKLRRKAGADGKTGKALNTLMGEGGQYKAETATLMQLWVQETMDVEEVIGRPVDGQKFVAEKVYDGDIVLGPESLCIGYMDILPVKVMVEREQIKADGSREIIMVEEKRTLAEALYEGRFFNPGQKDTGTMSGFRDAMEQGGDAFAYFKGDIPFPIGKPPREMDEWIKKRNKVLGLDRDIKQNGRSVFADTLRDPKVIESLILGCFGIDRMSLAVGRPMLDCPNQDVRATYTEAVVKSMRLLADWARPDEVLNVLEGKPAISPRSGWRPFADTSQSIISETVIYRYGQLMNEYNEKRKNHPRRTE